MTPKDSFAVRDWLCALIESDGALVADKGVLMVPPFTADIYCIVDGKTFEITITPGSQTSPTAGSDHPTK